MKKSLVALAFGTLALGIAEFVMMAILPYVAGDLHVSIATAGHLISAYALGVCVGAPALIFARRLPLKRILLILVCLMIAGNLCAAVAPGYGVLMLARFVSGLPHGAYFGVGSIVAEKLADEGKGAEAVSIMIAGMTDAQRGAVLAGYFPAGGLLGVGRAAVRLALGAAGRRFARYRLQGAIPFLSQKGAMAVARSDAAG